MRSIRHIAVMSAMAAASFSAHAAEPLLRLETPAVLTSSSNPSSPPRETVQLGASQIQSMLGSSYFSSESASLFQGLSSFRTSIGNEMRLAFLSTSGIERVNSVVVTTKPITATLSGSGSSIGVAVSGIKATVDAKADGPLPIFCSSVNFVVDITFNGNGSFNPSLLEVGNLQFNATPNVRSASCSGIFGFLGNLLGSIMNGESVRSVTQDKMRQQLAQFSGFGSIPTMFSLSGINVNILNRLPASPVRDRILNVTSRFLTPGAVRDGLRLSLSLHDNFSGTGGHLISLLASQQAAPGFLEFIGNGNHLLDVGSAPGASSVDLYTRLHSFTNSIGSILPGGFRTISGQGGTTVWGVTNSALVSGLRSLPARYGQISGSTGTDCQFQEFGCSEVP